MKIVLNIIQSAFLFTLLSNNVKCESKVEQDNKISKIDEFGDQETVDLAETKQKPTKENLKAKSETTNEKTDLIKKRSQETVEGAQNKAMGVFDSLMDGMQNALGSNDAKDAKKSS
jgi:hypothetical protein